MSDSAINAAIISHAGQLGEQNAEIAKLQSEVSELRSEVKEILAILNEARGGWKSMVAIGGLASAATAAVSWAMNHLWPHS